MKYQHLLLTVDGPITTITLNRPEKRNALALPVMLELTSALREVAKSDARGVILAANGPVFSAGHNFADMAGATLAQAQELFAICTTMMDAIQAMPQVVVARVHALATAAGCQLVASCDLAVAADSAGFARRSAFHRHHSTRFILVSGGCLSGCGAVLAERWLFERGTAQRFAKGAHLRRWIGGSSTGRRLSP